MTAASLSTALPQPNPVALRLAHAGLLPFMVGALLVWLFGGAYPEQHVFVTFALSAYAALIISFLGGIYWGFAFREAEPDTKTFVWGITPALVAWMGVLMPAYAGLVVQGAMLVICYSVDRRLYPQHGAAAWLNLRFRLSAVAALSCFLGAAGS